jgi:hypothetical protein
MVRMQCLIESNWFCQFLISNNDFYIVLTLPCFFFCEILSSVFVSQELLTIPKKVENKIDLVAMVF